MPCESSCGEGSEYVWQRGGRDFCAVLLVCSLVQSLRTSLRLDFIRDHYFSEDSLQNIWDANNISELALPFLSLQANLLERKDL